jgi:hypothetical protein
VATLDVLHFVREYTRQFFRALRGRDQSRVHNDDAAGEGEGVWCVILCDVHVILKSGVGRESGDHRPRRLVCRPLVFQSQSDAHALEGHATQPNLVLHRHTVGKPVGNCARAQEKQDQQHNGQRE